MSQQPTAWVTGATGYWGRKVILALFRKGYAVVALSRSIPQELIRWAEARNHALTWQHLDFSNMDFTHGLCGLEVLTPPKVVFHCAAMLGEEAEMVFRVNTVQPILFIQQVLRMMDPAGGRIGVFLGQNGRIGLPGLGVFSASQGALWTWAEAEGKKLKQENSPASISLVFPPRAASKLQGELAKRLPKPVKTNPKVMGDNLVAGVLAGKFRVGRKPIGAAVMTALL